MPTDVSRNPAESDETILEFAVRDRLSKEQIRDLLDSMGALTSGARAEMAERLLGLRGLKDREVLNLLSNDDLKRVAKRFGIPESTGGGGLFETFFSDARKDLVDRISKAAAKERAPRPKSVTGAAAAAATPVPGQLYHAQTPEVPQRAPPPFRSSPGGIVSQTSGVPAFQEVRDFVGAYKFGYQYDDEDLYEAELLGALRGKYGISNAVRQQGDTGRVYDIVVGNSTRIEMKLPKSKTDLDRMVGQVLSYLAKSHPGGVIVVIVSFQMKNQQEIHNRQQELERAGALVFVN